MIVRGISRKIAMICIAEPLYKDFKKNTSSQTINGWIRNGNANTKILEQCLKEIRFKVSDLSKSDEEFAELVCKNANNEYEASFIFDSAMKLVEKKSKMKQDNCGEESLRCFIDRLGWRDADQINEVYCRLSGKYIMYNHAISRPNSIMIACVDVYGVEDNHMLVRIQWDNLPVYKGIVIVFSNKLYFIVVSDSGHEAIHITVFNPFLTGRGSSSGELHGVLMACTEDASAVPKAVNIYMKKCKLSSSEGECPDEKRLNEFELKEIKDRLRNKSRSAYVLMPFIPDYVSLG